MRQLSAEKVMLLCERECDVAVGNGGMNHIVF